MSKLNQDDLYNVIKDFDNGITVEEMCSLLEDELSHSLYPGRVLGPMLARLTADRRIIKSGDDVYIASSRVTPAAPAAPVPVHPPPLCRAI